MTDDESDPTDSIDFETLRQPQPSQGYLQPHHVPRNLHTLYVRLGWTQSDIADFYDVDQSTISYYLDKYDIDTRDKRAQQQARRRKLHRLKHKRFMGRAGD